MEELHVNGVGEHQTPPDVVPADQTRESVINNNDDVFRAESASQSPVKATVTLQSRKEQRISSGENEIGDEKKYTYVIRSRTSVEEYSTASSESTEEPPVPNPSRLVIRSRSTDETTEFEKSVREDDKPEEAESSDVNMTQAIAAQAIEMVKSLIEKLENEQDDQNRQIQEENRFSGAQTNQVTRTEPPSETSVREMEQCQSIEKENDDELVTDTYSEERSLAEQAKSIDETGNIESVSLDTGISVQSAAMQEKEEKAEVVSMNFDTNEDKYLEEHLVSSEAAIQETPVIESRIEVGKAKPEGEELGGIEELPLKEENDFASPPQSDDDVKEEEEVFERKVERKREEADEEVLVSVETTPETTIPANELKSNADEKGKADTREVKFESIRDQFNREQFSDLETAEITILPMEVKSKEIESNAGEEDKAEKMIILVDTQEEQSEGNTVMKSEEGTSDESGIKVDEESKAQTIVMEFETPGEKYDEEVITTVESTEVKTFPEEIKTKEGERKVEGESKAETMTMTFETPEEIYDEQVIATAESTEVKTFPEEVKTKDGERKVEEQSKAETMTMTFETPEEIYDEQVIATAVSTEVKSLPEEVRTEDSESKIEEESKQETMAIVMPEEKTDEQSLVTAETTEVRSLEIKPEDSESRLEEDSKAETMSLASVTPAEKSEDQSIVRVETTEVKSLPEEVKSEESESIQDGKVELMSMPFETEEKNYDKQNIDTAEETEQKSMVVEVEHVESQSGPDEVSKVAETMAMTFETQVAKSDEEKLVEEVSDHADILSVEVSSVEMEQKSDEENKAVQKFEEKEEQFDEQQLVTVETTQVKSLPIEAMSDEETLVNEGNAEVEPLPEMVSKTEQEMKSEMMKINFESKEFQSDDQNVDISETSLANLESNEALQESEILSMTFESKEEQSDEEKLAFADTQTEKSEIEPAQEIKDKTSSSGSAVIEGQEEPSSPKQEYVAEHFRQDTQTLQEIQEGNSEKPEEKPIIKVRLPEEPLSTITKDNRYDDDVIELDTHVVESPTEIALDTFEEGSDSDGEIDVTIERLSQENEQLIKEGESDEEGTADDWMAKDDTDEIVFKGKAELVTDIEDTRQDKVQQKSQPSVENIDIETRGDIGDEVIFAHTKALTVCSDIGGFFTPEEGAHMQADEAPKVVPAPEYDINKDIEEETQRLIQKNTTTVDDSSIAVTEEILPNQQRKKEESEFNIFLVDDKEKDEDEEKPPSPVEAKKVTEEGITEIFETEELRRSGIFDDTLVEEDEDTLKGQSQISQRDVVLANEEYFEAKEKEKHASLRWSLLEKWEEMNKRQSLEMRESEAKAIVTTGNETQENQTVITENEVRATEKPFVHETLSTETTPSSITTVKTSKAVTTARVIKARAEALPETVKDEKAVYEEETTQDSNRESVQAISSQLPQESQPSSQRGPVHRDQTEEQLQNVNLEALQSEPCIAVIEDGPATSSGETNSVHQEESQHAEREEAASMSTILFRMDGTPVVIPPVAQEQPKPYTAEKQEKRSQPTLQKDEKETKPEPVESSQMSTILFRMDGTPFVVPNAAPGKSSPKLKSVNFNSETSVRPLSVNSVESVRGEREGVPPLAGEEESDIDDSSLHLAKYAHSGSSRAPTVSPVEEVSAPPSPRLIRDDDNEDKKEDADSPLLDQSQPGAEKGQKCCIIL